MIRAYSGDLELLQNSLSPIIYGMTERAKSIESSDLFLTKGYTTTFIGEQGCHLNTLSEFDALTEFVVETANQYFDAHELPKDKLKIVMNWANVYPTGAYIRPHQHITFKHLISAVFYLRNSGILYIKDRDPVSINEGEVCLFPSGIEHWTTANETEQDRLMIGYDIYYGDKSDTEIQSVLHSFMIRK